MPIHVYHPDGSFEEVDEYNDDYHFKYREMSVRCFDFIEQTKNGKWYKQQNIHFRPNQDILTLLPLELYLGSSRALDKRILHWFWKAKCRLVVVLPAFWGNQLVQHKIAMFL